MKHRPGCTDPHPPPPDGVDPLSSSVFIAFKRVMHLNRRLLMRTVSASGGHPAQAGCLWAIASHDGISQRDLADLLHLSRPTVTTMLQKLERAGLVQRWDDETDQRITRIRVTDSGRSFNDALRSAHAAYVDAAIGPMSVPDRLELERLLTMLASNIESALDGPEDHPASRDGKATDTDD